MDSNQLSSEIKQDCFNAFIDEFKENTLLTKEKIVINELQELIVLFQKLCRMNGKNSELLVNKEIIDIYENKYTQDDFAEAVYTYIQMFKEVLAEYMLSIDNDSLEN